MPKAPKKSPGQKQLARSRTAIHEASHAVAAWFDPLLPAVKKASIRPKGNRLGYVVIRWKKKHSANATREEWMAVIRFSLASLAGEKLGLGAHAGGVHGDLEMATDLARLMVCSFGMGTSIGPVSIESLTWDPKLAAQANADIMRILRTCRREVAKRLKPHKQRILMLTHALLEHEELKTRHLKRILGPRPKRKK